MQGGFFLSILKGYASANTYSSFGSVASQSALVVHCCRLGRECLPESSYPVTGRSGLIRNKREDLLIPIDT